MKMKINYTERKARFPWAPSRSTTDDVTPLMHSYIQTDRHTDHRSHDNILKVVSTESGYKNKPT